MLKPWYERKKSQYQQRGGKAIVALLRKLCLAVFAVGRGATLDESRLFPGRNVNGSQGSRPFGFGHCEVLGLVSTRALSSIAAKPSSHM